jgi:hypothetical protein
MILKFYSMNDVILICNRFKNNIQRLKSICKKINFYRVDFNLIIINEPKKIINL